MNAVAAWLDKPMVYWIGAWASIALSLGTLLLPRLAAAAPGLPDRLRRLACSPWIFLGFAGVLILVLRLPSLAHPFSLNADEPQAIAQAITLTYDIAFYRSVQSGSAGPLWSFVLLWPALLDLDITYATSRLTGIALFWITCVALHFALRFAVAELPARVATLSAALCYAASTKADFLHYSSEHPALPLIMTACFLVLRCRESCGRHPARNCYLLGLTLGAVPFSKLVATLIALPIAVMGFFAIFAARDIDRRVRNRRLAALVSGGLSMPVFWFALAASTGDFRYFWQTYIVSMYQYKERGQSLPEVLNAYLGQPLIRQPNYEYFLIGVLVFLVVRVAWIGVRRRQTRLGPVFGLLLAAIVAGSSCYATFAPGRGFPHYLLLTIAPLCFLAGMLMSGPKPGADAPAREAASPAPSAFCPAPAWLAIACLLAPLLAWAARPLHFKTSQEYYSLDGSLGQISELRLAPKTPATQYILAFREPRDRLTVWGWRADYHVDTQLGMGTRSACPEFQIIDSPMREFYRQTAIEELKQRQPAFFLDAAGPLSINFTDRASFGHEVFPELADHIRAHYAFAGENNAERLYVRNDRFYRIKAAPREPAAPAVPAPQPVPGN